MARFFQKRDQNRGRSPSSPIFIGEQKTDEIKIRVIDYSRDVLREETLREVRGEVDANESSTVTWLNVDGLHDSVWIRELGNYLAIHPLLLEDVLNTGQRPKMEDFGEVIFLVVKMLQYDETAQIVTAEQLSLVVGPSFVVTFQEQPGDVFEPVRERIRKSNSRIRASGSDYLAYALLDTVVDNYIYIVERLGEQIEDLEEEVLDNPEPTVISEINTFRREIGFLRKSVRPARDAVSQLAKLDSELIHAETLPFLRDLQDLASQAVEAIETYREMLSDQLNIYNSLVSNRMNDIMKVLTIFAAIFIPLTFIAGIYGTNFEYLPELQYRYSYFVFWGVMITVACVMLLFFKRKKWL